MCDSDYDSVTTLTREWRRAKKTHKCYACYEEIRPGDRYHVAIELSDGFQVFKHCARCWMMVEAIWHAGATSVQYDLNCGVAWEDEFDDMPDDVAALAFLTPDEAQALVKDAQEPG